MITFKLSPKSPSKETIKEQIKEYLASLTDEEIKQLLKEVDEIKNKKLCQD